MKPRATTLMEDGLNSAGPMEDWSAFIARLANRYFATLIACLFCPDGSC
jgi:hypothetical protein